MNAICTSGLHRKSSAIKPSLLSESLPIFNSPIADAIVFCVLSKSAQKITSTVQKKGDKGRDFQGWIQIMKSLRKVCLQHKCYAEAEQLWEARGTTRPSMAPSRLTFYYHSQNSQGQGQLRIDTCSFQFVPKTKQPCLSIFFSFSILGRNEYMVTESLYNVSSQLLAA